MSEIKPVTFRIDSATTEKFKDLANNLGLTQGQMLENLISIFELENAKSNILDRGKEIEEFQNIAKRLISIYLNSLELNQSAETRIQEQFQDQLNKKQDLLLNLQDQLKELKEKVKNQELELNLRKEKNMDLEQSNLQYINTLKDKENLIKGYIEKNDTLSGLINEYSDFKTTNVSLCEKNIELSKSNENLELKLKNIELEKSNLEKQLEILNSSINEYKALLKEERLEYSHTMSELKNERKNDLNSIKTIYESQANKFKAEYDEKLNFEKAKLNFELQKLIANNESKEKELQQLKASLKSKKPKQTSSKSKTNN